MGKTELLELGEKTMAACKESGEHVGSTPVVLPCQPCRMCALATDWGSNYLRPRLRRRRWRDEAKRTQNRTGSLRKIVSNACGKLTRVFARHSGFAARNCDNKCT